MALPVLLGRVHAPQALLLWLAQYSPHRCGRLIISTISWALCLAGLAWATAKPHTDATATTMHSTTTLQPPLSSTRSYCSTAVDGKSSCSSSRRPW